MQVVRVERVVLGQTRSVSDESADSISRTGLWWSDVAQQDVVPTDHLLRDPALVVHQIAQHEELTKA